LTFFTSALLLFAALSATSVFAQAQGFTGKPLLRTTVSGDDTKEAVIGTAEFARGGTTGRHTHPGDEYGTILEGTLEFRVEGREPRRASAGEVFHNPRGSSMKPGTWVKELREWLARSSSTKANPLLSLRSSAQQKSGG
jgi:quercetin dioxygenase-like cupin family protein